MNTEKMLDYLVEHWKGTFAALLLAAAAGTGILAYAYEGALGKAVVFTGLLIMGLALKYPGRYATAGGTDIDTVLIVLVAAGMGVPYGLVFALIFIPIGSKIALESPQEATLSLAMHTGLVLLSGLFTATADNIVLFVMAFVILSVAVMGPVLYYTGHPVQPLVLGIIIKVAWGFAFTNMFGARIFELLR